MWMKHQNMCGVVMYKPTDQRMGTSNAHDLQKCNDASVHVLSVLIYVGIWAFMCIPGFKNRMDTWIWMGGMDKNDRSHLKKGINLLNFASAGRFTVATLKFSRKAARLAILEAGFLPRGRGGVRPLVAGYKWKSLGPSGQDEQISNK